MVSQNTLFTVILFHHLDDCDLYMPPWGVKGRQNQVENDQLGKNEELVPKRGTTSVAWTCVFKHCHFKTTDFKLLKHKQQSYLRAPSLFLCESSTEKKKKITCFRKAGQRGATIMYSMWKIVFFET